MASNTSSTSSSSSTTSAPPDGTAAAASTALVGAPCVNASSPAHALGGAPPTTTAPAPGVPPAAVAADSAHDVPTDSNTTLDASRRRSKGQKVDPSTIFAHEVLTGRGRWAPNPAPASASPPTNAFEFGNKRAWPPLGTNPPRVPRTLGSNLESTAPPSTFAPVMTSTEEVSSSSGSASPPFPSSYTVASDPTVTTPASAATSSTTLVPRAPTAFPPAVETSADDTDTAPKKDAPTSSPPVVLKTVSTKLRAEAPPFEPSSATGAVMAPAPGAAPTTASATIFGVNRIHATDAPPLYSDPVWAMRYCECVLSPAETVAARSRSVCPRCGLPYR